MTQQHPIPLPQGEPAAVPRLRGDATPAFAKDLLGAAGSFLGMTSFNLLLKHRKVKGLASMILLVC